MKILFFGTMEYSLEVLKELAKTNEIIGVCTKKDLVIGRKKEVVFAPVKVWAIDNNIKVYQKEKLSKDYQDLLELDFDILVTAAYGDFIPEKLLNHAKIICLNAHASLLPKYRGGSPIHAAIKNGDKYTGVTIMQMVKKMDAGAIIKQDKIEIEFSDTASTMFEKLSFLAARLMNEVVSDIDNITLTEQVEEEVTFSLNIKYEEECLDFTKTSLEVYNHIRAYYSFPTTFSTINDLKVKVFASKISDIVSEEKEGTVLDITKEGILVKTLDSSIYLTDIQVSGKKRMLVKDFINGNKQIKKGDVFYKNI